MSKEFESEWNSELNEALHRYGDHSGPDTYADVLFLIMQGIRDDVPAVFPARLFDEGKKFPAFQTTVARFGSNLFYVMQTVPDESFGMTVGLKLRKMLDKVVADDKVRGIVINPAGDDRFFLQKKLIVQIMELYESEAPADSGDRSKEFEALDRERTSYKLSAMLPLSHAQYTAAESIVTNLEDHESFCIEFKKPFDDTLLVQTEKEGEAYRTEICFDMSDFGQNPLVLRSDGMTMEEVLNFMDTFCVKMIPSDDIPCIMNWRSKY